MDLQKTDVCDAKIVFDRCSEEGGGFGLPGKSKKNIIILSLLLNIIIFIKYFTI